MLLNIPYVSVTRNFYGSYMHVLYYLTIHFSSATVLQCSKQQFEHKLKYQT